MTNQEALDIMVPFLAKQGKRSKVENSCMYRSPEGLKCALGCLIPDEEYNPKMDAYMYDVNLLNLRQVIALSPTLKGTNFDFLLECQAAHDFSPDDTREEFMKNLLHRLNDVAVKYNLTMPEVSADC